MMVRFSDSDLFESSFFNSSSRSSSVIDLSGSREHVGNGGFSRRRFLTSSLASSAAILLAAGAAEELLTPALLAQSSLTPDEALKELMDGNARYVDGRLSYTDLKELREHTVDKQEPFAAVLACADSRVPVELVFDKSIGQIFVTRVAGNVATSEIIGSLEYGAAVLGTKVILVLGHGNCGAVKAAMYGNPVPGQISSLFPHIQPAVDQSHHDLDAAIRINAKIQADLLSKASPVLSGMLKDGKLKIVAGYYDLASGKVSLL
jgi:carbonic anhydrase